MYMYITYFYLYVLCLTQFFKLFRVLITRSNSRFFQSSPHLLFVTRNVQAEVKETKQTAIIIINMLPFIFQLLSIVFCLLLRRAFVKNFFRLFRASFFFNPTHKCSYFPFATHTNTYSVACTCSGCFYSQID